MTPRSPSLEDVSKEGDATKDESQELERRQLPRVSLPTEQFKLSPSGKLFSVQDLSPEGLALRVLEPEDLIYFTAGTHIEGVLNLKGKKLKVAAVVKHVGRSYVGCRFESLEGEALQQLTDFLDPGRLGKELHALPTHDNEKILWFHGPSGADLLFWRGAQREYRRVCLHIYGSYIQWDEEKGLETGTSMASDDRPEVNGLIRLETCLLDPDSSPDEQKLKLAKTLILSSNLPKELMNWCVGQFFPN